MRGLLLWTFFVAAAWAQLPVVARPFRLAELHTPPGFEVTVFASLNVAPRLITFAPNGVLYAAARDAGLVIAVREGKEPVAVLRELPGPHSVMFRGNDLYVAVDDGVLRFREAVTDDLVIHSEGERL